MSRSGAGALPSLSLAALLAAMVVACSPVANALPTAQPTLVTNADPSADAASPLPSGPLTDPAGAWPAYAACLRSHGLQVDDPEVDGNGDPVWATDIKRGMTRKIDADCGPIIAALTKTGDSRHRTPNTYESELAHAACMREHGLTDWPDPDPNKPGGGMPEGYDKADPTVYAGLVACEHVLVEATASPSPAP